MRETRKARAARLEHARRAAAIRAERPAFRDRAGRWRESTTGRFSPPPPPRRAPVKRVQSPRDFVEVLRQTSERVTRTAVDLKFSPRYGWRLGMRPVGYADARAILRSTKPKQRAALKRAGDCVIAIRVRAQQGTQPLRKGDTTYRKLRPEQEWFTIAFARGDVAIAHAIWELGHLAERAPFTRVFDIAIRPFKARKR